ncbi:hypothetical protein FA95DRAFT_1676490 [Auriscalpium vulgare]|uniref:Uncharacterized protein n=1 Tax=Auriscalpium vulgare TaxID=40419 RepID=A0ACB8S2N8_9AGAM|nr:hypothetical protein FA95DRAFT_1676490 [Auriscalpium vulgare]
MMEDFSLDISECGLDGVPGRILGHQSAILPTPAISTHAPTSGTRHVKLTGYRLFNMALAIAVATAKAVLSYKGFSTAPVALEWIFGGAGAVGLYYLGFYETVQPPLWPWFFHEDHSDVVVLHLLRFLAHAVQFDDGVAFFVLLPSFYALARFISMLRAHGVAEILMLLLFLTSSVILYVSYKRSVKALRELVLLTQPGQSLKAIVLDYGTENRRGVCYAHTERVASCLGFICALSLYCTISYLGLDWLFPSHSRIENASSAR